MDRHILGLTPEPSAAENIEADQENAAPICRGVRSHCAIEGEGHPVCADCHFLHEQHFHGPEDADFLRHCRAIRQYLDEGIVSSFSSHIAALLLSPSGRVIEIDERSEAFLRSTGHLGIRQQRLGSTNFDFHGGLLNAIDRTARTGGAETLICPGPIAAQQRYALLLLPSPRLNDDRTVSPLDVICLVFPLGRRRVASVRQLMALFGLSAAEARLARALCHGEMLEEYARAQGVKLPTVKTQLRAVFSKTQTTRQVALVSLITGIPPLR